MDFKKILTAPMHAGQAVVRDLMDQPDPEQAASKQQVMDMLSGQMDSAQKQFVPPPAPTGWQPPHLDDTLTEEAQNAKKEMEAKGQPFTPGEGDYVDPDYLRKKEFTDALNEYEQELQKNTPHIDYEGIMKQRMADLANAPEAHRTNPLYLFAMGMGNPEHAAELVKEHNQSEADANKKEQERWKELLDMKEQALEGSIKQAMAEGDHRKIVSGKWLEQLAQIQRDRMGVDKLLQGIDARNQGSLDRIQLRQNWASQQLKQRLDAMASQNGVKAESSEWRAIQRDATAMSDSMIRKGMDPAQAAAAAQDWAEERLNERARTRGNAPAKAAPPPATGGTPGKTGNPLIDDLNAH